MYCCGTFVVSTPIFTRASLLLRSMTCCSNTPRTSASLLYSSSANSPLLNASSRTPDCSAKNPLTSSRGKPISSSLTPARESAYRCEARRRSPSLSSCVFSSSLSPAIASTSAFAVSFTRRRAVSKPKACRILIERLPVLPMSACLSL